MIYSRFNSALAANRRANIDGIYDPHTNFTCFPKTLQPTHAKWEEVVADIIEPFDGAVIRKPLPANGISNGIDGADAINGNHTLVETAKTDSIFSPVTAIISRNFLITDTYLQSAPVPAVGVPGSDGDYADVGANGLSGVPEDVLAELPPECRQAFDAAKQREFEWKSTWSTELKDGARGHHKIGFSGYPV